APRGRCRELALRRRDEPGGLRLAARGGVPVQRAPGGGAIEPAYESAVLGLDLVLVPGGDRSFETLRQRLRGRAVAQVLEPLPGGRANALLLLVDVRHRVKRPAIRGREDGTKGALSLGCAVQRP